MHGLASTEHRLHTVTMPKKKAADSDAESSDDSELHEVRREPLKVTAAASSRPRRATAGAGMQKLTKKLMDEEDEEGSEDEFPTIPKTVLTKYKDSINAAPGTIHVIRKADVVPAMLKALKVEQWPVWANSTGGWPELNHPYEYEHEAKELAVFLEGSCSVAPEGGEPVELFPGDFAVFPKKLVCTWTILEPLKKYYMELK